MIAIAAYDEVASLLAKLDPAKVITLQPSEDSCKRMSLLLQKNRDGKLFNDENYELERLLALDHLIALAKAHARFQLKA